MQEFRLGEYSAAPISHGTLLPLLAEYRRPNDKIAEWLSQGVLVPLKRGLYVIGPNWRQMPLCLPLIANRLYGPSCVSLDYALSWHGLIPERVYEVTSVCLRRGRLFENPVGRFSYVTLPAALFPIGVQQQQAAQTQQFLIAGPTKALCDKVLLTRNLRITGRASMQRFLFEDLRIDEDELLSLGVDWPVINAYAGSGYKTRQMQALAQVLEKLT